jgi:hypothetical protein
MIFTAARPKNRVRKLLLYILPGVVGGSFILLARQSPAFTEAVYSQGLFRWVRVFVSAPTRFCPFRLWAPSFIWAA